MEKYVLKEINSANEFPGYLKEIEDLPKKLWLLGSPPPIHNKFLCIVGTRKPTAYGREVCRTLIAGLSGYPITIVSGMALGIDSIAHETALECGMNTISIPGSGLSPEVLYPRSRYNLAKRILDSGGALYSEFEANVKAAPWMFPQRNRIMAGISHMTIVIESEIKSGSLITYRLALSYNRDVGAVPGPIFSSLSSGPNFLLTLGAIPITSSEDILHALNLNPDVGTNAKTNEEKVSLLT